MMNGESHLAKTVRETALSDSCAQDVGFHSGGRERICSAQEHGLES